ncbi:AAA family ATPase [Oceanospirillaceae bacterium ASx5O]|nr:AAA family ATPase [Oceanospirillaceae bacterium ASx5O]
MRTLAIYQLKGGVGKTTTAVNVAALAAQEGLRTLVWDLDPQGAAGWMLNAEARQPQLQLWQQQQPINHFICHTGVERLDVLPGDMSLRKLLQLFPKRKQTRDFLAAALSQLSETYGLVILDCPPLLSPTMDGVLQAADRILLPVEPSALSLRAYHQLREHCDWVKSAQWLPFANLIDRRKPAHGQWIRDTLPEHPEFLPTFVAWSATAERMAQNRTPVVLEQPATPMARNYRALWQTVRPLLKLG